MMRDDSPGKMSYFAIDTAALLEGYKRYKRHNMANSDCIHLICVALSDNSGGEVLFV
jgi:hypothetical protein